MRTLAVIPARGGSKGIPRKNMRLMHGRPLIEYAILNALACPLVDDVVVSSDSEEILAFAAQFEGVVPLDRDSALAQDAVTLDPVVYDAVLRREGQLGQRFDAVVTMQPTSPLLTVETLTAALESFAAGEADTLISVVNAPHLSWTRGADGSVVPAYEKRLNRQQLPPNYLETGAFLIAKRANVTQDSRIAGKVGVFEVPASEATDIDSAEDWAVCEAALGRKRVVFRVDAHRELGMGHVYRCITLAYDMVGHEVTFVCDAAYPLGGEFLRERNMRVVEVDGDEGFLSWLERNPCDVVVNDMLDTSSAYIQALKERVPRVVTVEDLGPGARHADAVVNALYEGAPVSPNAFTGSRYVCLRDEFVASHPAPFSQEVRRVLVTFGGTDPLGLSERLYRIALSFGGRVAFDFVLGTGYEGGSLETVPDLGIEVHRGVLRMSDHMRQADLAVCSQGRTTYELASMGVPAIVLAQNERERLHTFAQMSNGFINLGLGSEVADEDIASTISWLMGATTVRAEMRKNMLANDLRSGIRRVKRTILEG